MIKIIELVNNKIDKSLPYFFKKIKGPTIMVVRQYIVDNFMSNLIEGISNDKDS